MEKEKRGLVLNVGNPRIDGFNMSRSRFRRYDVRKNYIDNNQNKNLKDSSSEIFKTYDIEDIDMTSPVDMALPGGDSSEFYSIKIIKSARESIIRWSFRLVSAGVVASILLGGFMFSLSYMNLNKALKGGAKTAASLQKNVSPSLLNGEGSGRINVLLLGRGGGNHDGPDLTDTILVASIDPVGKSIVLVSIPRDLWVDVPGHGAMKINAAWETGEFAQIGRVAPGSTDPKAITAGYQQADQVIEDVTGIHINYNVLVDFQAFRQAVDTIGGVTVDVPKDLVDPTMAWENNNNPVLAKAGTQIFDGTAALRYVRSRETTSDFARGERQRSVLIAIKQKAESMSVLSNPVKVSQLLSSFGNNINTDISFNDGNKLFNIIKQVDQSSIKSVGLTDAPNKFITTARYNTQSIDVPTEGMFKYDAIRQFIKSQLPDPYIAKENAKILLLNGTSDPGVLLTMTTKLKSYGYNIVATGNADTNNYAATAIINLSKNKYPYTMHYLEERLSASVVNSMPDKSLVQTNGANFVIIIGNNETVNN